MHEVYLGLGSNLGNTRRNLQEAIEKIDLQIGYVIRRSSFYASKPWGFQSEHDFLNACVCCATNLSAHEVLEHTQLIERQMGRTEKTVGGHYHDRVIDIDILLYDHEHIDEPGLHIPHPHMKERDFVMVPLHEIMP